LSCITWLLLVEGLTLSIFSGMVRVIGSAQRLPHVVDDDDDDDDDIAQQGRRFWPRVGMLS
jgi:hypothetical protein